VSVEGSGLLLGRGEKTVGAASNDGSAFLFRPIFNTDAGNPNAGAVVANPNQYGGGVIATQSSALWGVELNVVVAHDNTPSHIDWIVGLRHLNLKEELQIVERSTLIDPTGRSVLFFGSEALSALGDAIVAIDRFGTQNQFYGGQIGARASGNWGRLGGSITGQLALGGTAEQIRIQGQSTALSATGGATTLPGGLLAVASNSGLFYTGRFALLPELRLDLNYAITDHLRASLGYDVLYLSDVVRPGDQINLRVSEAEIPTSGTFEASTRVPSPPGPNFRHTDFWSQGLHAGLEFRY
jgi:hypothetical protein